MGHVCHFCSTDKNVEACEVNPLKLYGRQRARDEDCLRCTAAVEAQVPEGLVQWSSVGDAMFGIGDRHHHSHHHSHRHRHRHRHRGCCHHNQYNSFRWSKHFPVLHVQGPQMWNNVVWTAR